MNTKVFYCIHSKGGSGASLFSTNFAYTLAKQNKKVLFLDANQFSDIAYFFGIKQKKDILNLNMFLDEIKNKKISKQKTTDIFTKTTYFINKLDVLLSPQNYHSLTELNFLYQKILTYAINIYDYIIVDIEKNGKLLANKNIPSPETIFLITTIDALSIAKSTNFINKINKHYTFPKINIVYNQTGNFSKKELSNIFDYPLSCSLPTEINGAWDNIFLGVPIVENNRLKYSKQLNNLTKNILSDSVES